jgi:hypothetical protein
VTDFTGIQIHLEYERKLGSDRFHRYIFQFTYRIGEGLEIGRFHRCSDSFRIGEEQANESESLRPHR